MKRAYVDIPEGQMHYRYAGSGEPIICLHISGSGSDEYDKVGDLLADRFKVYALDLMGMYFSDPPPKLYNMQEHANTVIEFMDALSIDKAIIAGTCGGSNLATRIAFNWPERVSKLVVMQPVYMPHLGDMHDRRANFHPIQYSDDGSYLLEFWKRIDKYKYPPEINMLRALDQIQSGPEYSEIIHEAMFDDANMADFYPHLKMPVTVLRFENYDAPESPYAQAVADMIPGAKLDTIRDANIYDGRSNPHKVADMLRKHLA